MSFPRYPAYKDSGVAWLGPVPSHWAVKRLRRVVQLNPSKSETAALSRSSEVTFLPMEAIGEDGSLALDRLRPIGELESGYTYFAEGDVAIAKITPCFENGKGAVMRGLHGGLGFGTTELIVARPLPKHLDSGYLHRIFTSRPFMQQGEASMYGAGGQKRVPDDFVRDFAIALPPVDEQVVINAFLDRETAKIDALVAEQEQLITLLKEKRQAVISHAVTKGLDPSVPMKDSGVEWLGEVPAHWSVQPLGTLTRAIQTGPFGSQLHSNEYVDDATPVINPSNIIDGQLCPEPSATVTDEVVERLAHHKLIAGDIVVGRRGEMGRCAVVMQPQAGWLCGTGCLKIQLNSTALPEFVWRYLSTETIKQYLSLQSVGSTMENLNTQILARVPVPVPSATEQAAICEAVSAQLKALAALESEAIAGVRLLQERRSALISAAVTGQIDVRGLAPAQEQAA